MPYNNYSIPEYPCKEDMWDSLKREKRPILVYGMGNGADKLLSRLAGYGVEVADFFASDGFVRGHSFHGKRVKSFSEVKAEYSDFVILLSFASNRTEVLDMLSEIDANYDMLVPDMPVAGEEYFDREFYNSNYREILRAYGALCDEDSRRAFAAILNYRLTGRMSYLMGAFSSKAEMYSLISKREIRALIDAGAYNGDTVREAIEYFPSLSSVVAIEADVKNFKKLKKYADTVEQIKLECINAAVWNECGEASFISSGNRNSSVNSTASFEHGETSVPLLRIDSLSPASVDYVKYDVEGAEYEALLGTVGLIEAQRPTLLISLYHRSRDIFYLVNFMKDKYPDYSFYIRRLRCLPSWEINLIMIPKS